MRGYGDEFRYFAEEGANLEKILNWGPNFGEKIRFLVKNSINLK